MNNVFAVINIKTKTIVGCYDKKKATTLCDEFNTIHKRVVDEIIYKVIELAYVKGLED